MTRRFTADRRRSRLARRHLLSRRAADPAAVADALVALHGTDPTSVYLAAFARITDPRVEVVERPLYEERRLVRLLGMRRTMFVASREVAPLIQASSSRTVAEDERRKLLRFLADTDPGRDPEAWLADAERAALAVLEEIGEASAAELAAADPRLAERIVIGAGRKWSTTASMASRVLVLLGASGRIVRTRPRGSWVSSQYRWAPYERWIGAPLREIPVADARAAIVRRWLAAFGPGTFDDLRWWTGWRVADLRPALDAVAPVEVELDHGTGFVLPDDVDDDEDHTPDPWAALLPSLDPTVMGWGPRDRAWYLGDHAPLLFDTSGNAGPTVWWDGRVVGAWGQRRSDGAIVTKLLEDVGSDAEAAITAEIARLATAIGETIVVPRFDSPLGRELANG